MSKEKDGCGALVVVVLLLVCCGGPIQCMSQQNAEKQRLEQLAQQRQQEEAREAAKRVQEQRDRELEPVLREFARENVPALQELLDKLDSEIKGRRARLEKIKGVLLKFNKTPSEDKDYALWARIIQDLEGERSSLLAAREKLYLDQIKLQEAIAQGVEVDSALRDKEIKKVKNTVTERAETVRAILRRSEGGNEAGSAATGKETAKGTKKDE